MIDGVHMIAPGIGPPPGGADLVGNKAYNLMRLCAAGMPVPPGFVLSVDWCRRRRAGSLTEEELEAALSSGIARLEALTGQRFGSERKPLLVSVRSGAKASMPGMMETVLDIGLNDHTAEGMIRATGNPRLAWDSYRRLIQGYAEVVEGMAPATMEEPVEAVVAADGLDSERNLDYAQLRRLTQEMLVRYRRASGKVFPQNPRAQLAAAAMAVLDSWDAPKAVEYRRVTGLPQDAGTAVTVQTMVFGNSGGTSGSGVGFTRNPVSGADELYIDFQFNAQGEDVVSGRHPTGDTRRLRATLPQVWGQLEAMRRQLELLFGDMQDFEFTVQDGLLLLLQTRRGKRTNWAAVEIAVALVKEGIVKPEEALALIEGIDLDQVVRKRAQESASPPLARAIAASDGVATGPVALDMDAVKRYAAQGVAPILVRREIATADIAGLAGAGGILTELGGRTSHAAVVARQLGKVCLVGCSDLSIDLGRRAFAIGNVRLGEGEIVTLEGNDGAIYGGKLEVTLERPQAALDVIKGWRAVAA
jgi:pyruvate,orthophosphate dikinase